MHDIVDIKSHKPVMLYEAVSRLDIKQNGMYLDATFGGGGHSRAILETNESVKLLSLDCDIEAQIRSMDLKKDFPNRFTFRLARFNEIGEQWRQEFGEHKADGIIFDLGVSSFQLDTANRGFSFMREGELDMRMHQSGVSAKDVVNQYSMQKLADIFFIYGEERKAYRIAKAIVAQRQRQAFETTHQLAQICEEVLRNYKQKIHPATRIFQALRIYVNDELRQIFYAMREAEDILKVGGYLAVLSFHSLEDRIVKRCFRYAQGVWPRFLHNPMNLENICPSLQAVPRKPLYPTEEEIQYNPRSRSAKLRIAKRLDAPARLAFCQEDLFIKTI